MQLSLKEKIIVGIFVIILIAALVLVAFGANSGDKPDTSPGAIPSSEAINPLVINSSPTSAPTSNNSIPPTVPLVTVTPAKSNQTVAAVPPTVAPTTQPTVQFITTNQQPTVTNSSIKDGNCVASGLPAYIRPEHLSALQPALRQNNAALPTMLPLYQLNIKLNPAALTYSGQANISFWNRAPQTMPLVMLRTYPDFFKEIGGALELKEAVINGKPAILRDRSLTYVEVVPAEAISACSRVELTVNFNGKLVNQLREDLYAVGTFYAGQGFFALGTFYPQLAIWEKAPNKTNWDWSVTPMRASSDLTAAESAFYDVKIQAPASYQLFGSGVLTEPEKTEGANKNWRFVGGPFREFAVIGSDNFSANQVSGKTTTGNVNVRVVYANSTDANTTNLQKSFATKALAAAITTLDEFGNLVGAYPYVEYTLVEFPLAGFNGIEWPMFSQFSFGLFRHSYVGEEEVFGGLAYSKPGTLVIIHEVLHQWWYNIVGNDQQLEPFIDEGLTEFSTYLIPELAAKRTNSPPEVARNFAQGWLDKLRIRIKQQDLPTYGDLKINSAASELDLAQAGFVYYRKAPIFYDAFRSRFGDAALFNFLKAYFQHNQYKLVHYTDLVEALIKAVPGREGEVQTFINGWFNEKRLKTDLDAR